jgi:hypothetical protein
MRPRTLPPGTVRWTEYDGGRYVFGIVTPPEGSERLVSVLIEVVSPAELGLARAIRRQIAEALMRDQGRELEEERPDEPRLPFGQGVPCEHPRLGEYGVCRDCGKAQEVQP